MCRSAAPGSGSAVLGKPVGTNQKKALFRVPSFIREGSDRLERGRVWGNRRFLPHMERSGSPRRSGAGHLAMPNGLGHKRKRHLSVPFSFGCGRWDSNPHTEVLASKTRASTIPPLPLISLWPCTFTKQQADKYPYYTIFSLGLSIPRPVPTVRGLPVHRRCVRIES